MIPIRLFIIPRLPRLSKKRGAVRNVSELPLVALIVLPVR